jgi:methyltransferase family protein
VAFSPSSRGRLTIRDLDRFPDGTLFHRLARALCRAGCLPRKELYEAWEVGRRVRRLCRGGRVVDVCAAHGLLAQVLLLLDDTSPGALAVDTRLAPSGAKIHRALVEEWPRLAGRVTFVEAGLEDVDLAAGDLVVSIHACGATTDRVLERAARARARVAVVPCCHDADTCDAGGLGGWMDDPLAIDAVRALRLRDAGYRVWTQTIPSSITPKNRLLVAAPAA